LHTNKLPLNVMAVRLGTAQTQWLKQYMLAGSGSQAPERRICEAVAVPVRPKRIPGPEVPFQTSKALTAQIQYVKTPVS
jgi:hypothetical protein